MEKHFFRYQIVRYIADLRRMEPENIGIIVQSESDVTCRFRTRLGARKNVDFDNYRRWRQFFEDEICGPAVPIFQPERTSIEFLNYLQERSSGNYSLTRPLELVLASGNLKDAENHLFKTLVLPPDEKEREVRQPVQRFKSELEQRDILKHPAFKRKEIFKADGLQELVEYYYIRNHGADLPVLVQPVQILPDISRTIGALDRAEALVASIRAAKIRAEVAVVVDEIPAPSANDSETRKWAFDKIQKGKANLRKQDVEVADSTAKSIRLAADIQRDLNDIEPLPLQPQIAFP